MWSPNQGVINLAYSSDTVGDVISLRLEVFSKNSKRPDDYIGGSTIDITSLIKELKFIEDQDIVLYQNSSKEKEGTLRVTVRYFRQLPNTQVSTATLVTATLNNSTEDNEDYVKIYTLLCP